MGAPTFMIEELSEKFQAIIAYESDSFNHPCDTIQRLSELYRNEPELGYKKELPKTVGSLQRKPKPASAPKPTRPTR